MYLSSSKLTGGPVTLVTTAETAIVTSTQPPGSLLPLIGFSPPKIVVDGFVLVTPGTGTTAIVVRLRAGSGTGGALLATGNTIAVTAGAQGSFPFGEIDEGIEFPVGYVYTLTLQQTGATGNGTVNDCLMNVVPIITGQ